MPAVQSLCFHCKQGLWGSGAPSAAVDWKCLTSTGKQAISLDTPPAPKGRQWIHKKHN